MYPKNSILSILLDKEFLLSEESGVVKRPRNKEQRGKEICDSQGLVQVNFSFTASFFAILCFGLMSSIIMFVIELVLFYCRWIGLLVGHSEQGTEQHAAQHIAQQP